MTEWFKVIVLKTIVCNYTVGSNPTLSKAIRRFELLFKDLQSFTLPIMLYSPNKLK
jgi:hypothetical protein